MILKKNISVYLRENIILLFILFLIYSAGVIFGSMGAVFLDASQTKEIAYFVERIFKEATIGNYKDFLPVLNLNFKLSTIIWFLGLTIIGVPLIAAVVFTKGFAIGFSSGFLIKIKGFAGIATIFLAIVPPNLFAVPLLLFAAANSIVFSLCLLKSAQTEINLSKNFLAFTLSMICIALLNTGISVIQTILSPIAVKAVNYICGRI